MIVLLIVLLCIVNGSYGLGVYQDESMFNNELASDEGENECRAFRDHAEFGIQETVDLSYSPGSWDQSVVPQSEWDQNAIYKEVHDDDLPWLAFRLTVLVGVHANGSDILMDSFSSLIDGRAS